jgi:hypothetical protein
MPTSQIALHVNTALHYILTSLASPWGWLSSRLPPASDQGIPGWRGYLVVAHSHQHEYSMPSVFILGCTILEFTHQYTDE